MSSCVKYPFHVRHNGVDYNPGEPFEVDNLEGHLMRGAVVVEKQQRQRRKGENTSRTAKAETET